MRLDIEKFRAEFEAAFGSQLTAQQLWVLVKMCKNVRLRCRNNTAFNNFMNSVFRPHAEFRTVTKQRSSWKNPGTMETYPGLSIIISGQEVAVEEEEEE